MDHIAQLKKLAGVTDTVYTEYNCNALSATQKTTIMKEHNIKPGTDAWFKLWFARPYLTGEMPFEGLNNNEL
jgi:hypothetical protein